MVVANLMIYRDVNRDYIDKLFVAALLGDPLPEN